MAAAVPAILSFVGTVATLAVSIANQPKKQDLPQPQLDKKKIDQEILDAQRRKGRLEFVPGESQLLAGGPIGSSQTLGPAQAQTLIGD